MRFWFLLYIILFFKNTTEAQNSFFRNFTEKEGLSHNRIQAFVQDDKGFLWIATSYGLNKFDGKNFTKFTSQQNNPNSISSSNLSSLTKDKQGNLWIGTPTNGLNKFDEYHNKFIRYTHQPNNSNSILNNEILSLFTDSKGNIWIGYEFNGWSKLNPITNQFTHYKSQLVFINKWQKNACNIITGFAEDKKGNIWITSGHGLHKQTVDNTIETIIEKEGTTNFENRNLYLTVVNFNDSLLTLGTWAGGLKTYNKYTKKFATYFIQPNPTNIGSKNIFDEIAAKSEHEIWLASLDKGLAIFNMQTKQFTNYTFNATNAHGTLPFECRTVFVDKVGNLFAGFDVGFSMLNPQWQQNYIFNNPTPSNPAFAATDAIHVHYNKPNNTVYAGIIGSYGLHSLSKDKKAWEKIKVAGTSSNEINKSYITSIYNWSINELLIRCNRKLFLYNILSNSVFPLILSYNNKVIEAKGVISERENEKCIWFLQDDSSYFKIQLGQQAIAQMGGEKAIKKFILPTGSTIFGNYTDSLIWVFDREKDNTLLMNFYTNELHENLLINYGKKTIGSTKQILLDKQQNIWITTYNEGLYKLTKTNNSLQFKVEHFTDKNGLPDMFLDEMLLDKQGNIWISCRTGMIYFNPQKPIFRIVNYKNGLPDKGYVSINFICFDEEDNLLVAGSINSAIIKTSNYTNASTNHIYFKRLDVLNKPWANDTLNINYQKKITLSYKENLFNAEIGVLNFSHTSNAAIHYQLINLDSNWRVAQNNFISFANLKPGKYTLNVKLIDEPSNTLSLIIVITPAFWQTWWFYLLVVLAILFAIYGLYKFRVSQIKKQEAIKTQLNKVIAETEMKALRAQMNPHFIFNSLNSINKYILQNDSDNASNYLTKFAKLIRLILDNSDNYTTTVKNEIDLVKLYIEMEQLRFKNKFSYNLTIDDDINTEVIQIPAMIIQPYVENAIWHGLLHKEDNGNLDIKIIKQNKQIVISIKDDGVGRARAAELKSKTALHQKSYGISLTNNRLKIANEQLGFKGEVTITDLMDDNKNAVGTLVELFIDKPNIS